MSFAYWCVLVAAILPYTVVGIAKARGSYDNRDPRKPGLYTGLAYRANAAHQNGLETFPFFAIAVLVASAASPHAVKPALDWLAGAYVILRLLYSAAYLADRPTTRSVVWSLAVLNTVAIFTMPAWQG